MGGINRKENSCCSAIGVCTLKEYEFDTFCSGIFHMQKIRLVFGASSLNLFRNKLELRFNMELYQT